MKKLFLLLFFTLTLSAEIVPGAGSVSAPLAEDQSLNTTIENVKTATAAATTKISTNTTAVLEGTKTAVKYFQNEPTSTSCQDATSLRCPPLNSSYSGSHMTMVDYINPVNGEVKCSVFPKNDLSQDFKESSKSAPVHSQVFHKNVCKQQFDESSNYDSSEVAKTMREEAKKRESEISNMQLKYDVDYKTSGGEKYLDLGDWLDALSTIDAEKIDIEKTLKQGRIHMNPGYTVVPNPSVTEGFIDSMKSLMAINHGDLNSEQIEKAIADNQNMDLKIKKVAGSSYVMYVDFFIESNKLINETINTLFVIFVLWNVLMNWISINASARFSGLAKSENHIHRLGFGIVLLVIFYSGDVSRITINNQEIEVKTQRIQDYLRALYGFTNDLSDGLAKIAISSYLKSLTTTSGVANVEMLDSLTSEKLALNKEITYLTQIDNQCTETYNLTAIENQLIDFRNKVLKNSVPEIKHVETHKETKTETLFGWSGIDILGFENVGGFDGIKNNYDEITTTEHFVSALKLNPYPASEREARAALFESKKTPYGADGFVNPGYFESAAYKADKQMISLSACSYNRKKVLGNYQRIKEIETKLAQNSNQMNYDQKLDKLKNVNDIMWKNYAELGYISIVFLPVTSYLLEQNGDLSDKAENKKDESTMQQISKYMAHLALFNGNQIAETINSAFGSTLVTKPIAIGGAILVIETMIEVVTIIVFVVSGVLAFILLALSKLWAFFAVLFLVIYAFSPNQEEKIYSSLGRVISTAFRTVLLTVSMFLAIWSLSLVDSLQHILLMDFFSNMSVINDVIDVKGGGLWDRITNFTSESVEQLSSDIERYVVYGVASVAFVAIKIILVVTIIFKLPSWFMEMLSAGAEGVEEKVNEVVQNASQQKTMKGI
ncbi:MAG: hypothetical protein Q7S59_04485 [Sulfurimonas sp.]|nr:hypothetical protein [Sulfurimonas sp.]